MLNFRNNHWPRTWELVQSLWNRALSLGTTFYTLPLSPILRFSLSIGSRPLQHAQSKLTEEAESFARKFLSLVPKMRALIVPNKRSGR